jgi:hypothetical protein
MGNSHSKRKKKQEKGQTQSGAGATVNPEYGMHACMPEIARKREKVLYRDLFFLRAGSEHSGSNTGFKQAHAECPVMPKEFMEQVSC